MRILVLVVIENGCILLFCPDLNIHTSSTNYLSELKLSIIDIISYSLNIELRDEIIIYYNIMTI